MRQYSLLILFSLIVGCAPKQDPGIPLPPPPTSGAAALNAADLAIAPQADTVKAIDAAKQVVSTNLANADTTGYKTFCCRVEAGRPMTYIDLEQGQLESTNRPLDVAISGNGFFRVKVDPNLGDGYAYTRNGNFFTNKDGQMVIGMGDGYRLDPPITIPPDATQTTISNTGVVSVLRTGQTAQQVVGQISLYQFGDPQSLNALSATLLQETDASGQALESKPNENAAGQLQQSFLEGSNVSLTREKLRMDFLDHWRATVLR